MGSETCALQRHKETRTRFTPHFIVDILGGEAEAALASDPRLDPGPCPPLVSLVSPASERGRQQQQHGQKKMRTTFTGRQIFVMEKMFESKKYLNANERSHLSRWVLL